MKKMIWILLFLFSALPAFAELKAPSSVNYEKIKTISDYQGLALSVVFSPDGKYLAVGTSAKEVNIWDATAWNKLTVLDDSSGGVTALAFSHDGKILAAGDSGKKVYLWDTTTWKRFLKIGPGNRVNAVAFNPTDNLLAMGCNDESAIVWDIKNDERYKKLKNRDGEVMDISFSPDGATVATGTRENVVNLWDAVSGEKKKVLKGHSDTVEHFSFSRDGSELVSGSSDGEIILWKLASGDGVKFPKDLLKRVCALAYVPNSNVLMSADCMIFQADPLMKYGYQSGEGCKIIFWNAGAQKPIKTLDSDCGLSSATFSPDGKYFVTTHAKHASGRGIITIYQKK